MTYQAKKLTRELLAVLLGSGLAGCGVTSEVATTRAHPSTAIESPRLAPTAATRPASPAGAASPPLRPIAQPAAPVAVASSVPRPVAEATAPAESSPVPARTLNVRTQSGRIIDEAGQPLVGATVLLKGTTRGASTDATGGYALDVPLGTNTFVFGYSGYQDEVAQSRDGQPLTVTLLPVAGRVAASQEKVAPAHPAKPRR